MAALSDGCVMVLSHLLPLGQHDTWEDILQFHFGKQGLPVPSGVVPDDGTSRRGVELDLFFFEISTNFINLQ